MNNANTNRSLLRTVIISIAVIMCVSVAGILFFQYVMEKNILPADNVDADTIYEKHYAFIVEDRTDPFWNEVYESAKAEGKKLGIYVEQTGSQLMGSYTTVQLLEMAVASNVDGIIVNPVDESASDMIETAAEKKISVETILNDTIGGSRACFVGVGNYKLGQEYGERIRSIMEDGTGKVLVLIDSNDSSNQNLIYSSIKDNLADTELKIETLLIDNDNTFGAEEAIRNIVLSTDLKRPDLLVCLSSLNTQCAYQAVVDYSKVGQVQIIGYYGSALALDAVKKEIIDSVIMVDGVQLGAKSVEALHEFQEKGRVNEYIVVDTKVIDQSNVNYYTARKAEVERDE